MTRSALVEAVEQFKRALAQIAVLPATPALRREQIKLQVALITPMIYVKGYSAPEAKAAVEQARLLIEQAEALGEPPEDPLLLFSVLYGIWVAKAFAFNGDDCRAVATRFLALAEEQGETAPLTLGHRLMGASLLFTGDFLESRAQLDRALALYDPAAHRALAARFGQDAGVTILGFRSWGMWCLGYPEAALGDAKQAAGDAREIGHAGALMVALGTGIWPHTFCGNYATASSLVDELVTLADEKSAVLWKVWGLLLRGWLFSLTGKTTDAVETITSALTAQRSTGAVSFIAPRLSDLARAYALLGQFEDAWRCIDDAMVAIETTKDKWWEAEVHRVAGEIALKSREPDAAKAEAYFERALVVSRQQQAKSWELRASMSLARLWRSQGKPQQARELLAPVYGWFTEGFDTLDLREAKALLDELAS